MTERRLLSRAMIDPQGVMHIEERRCGRDGCVPAAKDQERGGATSEPVVLPTTQRLRSALNRAAGHDIDRSDGSGKDLLDQTTYELRDWQAKATRFLGERLAIERERDALRAQLADLDDEIIQHVETILRYDGLLRDARLGVEAMRRALVAIQWGLRVRDTETTDVTASVYDYCPWCKAEQSAGHTPECIVAAALDQAPQQETVS